MADRIARPEEYEERFNHPDPKAALAYALDIRKFEIDLYWKRATYFWTLIAATFGAYFALSSANTTKPLLIFLIGCIGFVLSTGWYLVNRGSKYWQENWERHVDSLEDEHIGPLYKTTISKEQYSLWKPLSGYPYSVSRVNQIISLFVAILWGGIAVVSFLNAISPFNTNAVIALTLVPITGFFWFLLVWRGRSDPSRERVVDFRVSELVGIKNSGGEKAAQD